jgi:hypothetical protein
VNVGLAMAGEVAGGRAVATAFVVGGAIGVGAIAGWTATSVDGVP